MAQQYNIEFISNKPRFSERVWLVETNAIWFVGHQFQYFNLYFNSDSVFQTQFYLSHESKSFYVNYNIH